MKIAYVRWMDATQEEAAAPDTPVLPCLTELHEVGFYLGETDDVVSLGLEHMGEDNEAGRWRLHIPKSQIKEIHVKDLAKAFPLRKVQGKKESKKG